MSGAPYKVKATMEDINKALVGSVLDWTYNNINLYIEIQGLAVTYLTANQTHPGDNPGKDYLNEGWFVKSRMDTGEMMSHGDATATLLWWLNEEAK